MIRELTKNDLEEVNILLSSFNYSITEETFNSVFFKSLVYVDDKIKGVIVYSLIYDRIESSISLGISSVVRLSLIFIEFALSYSSTFC